MSHSNTMGYPYEGYNIIRMGYLRKIKTGRRKWFVLRRETADARARLEYYASEKKYQSGAPPKKIVTLKTCFNINLGTDTKYKSVIHLYTKDECLTLAADDESECEAWFKDLLSLQQGEDLSEGTVPKPIFAHVWEVTIVNRGVGVKHGIVGNYRLCLTENALSLVRRDGDKKEPSTEIKLTNIRGCGSLKNYIFFEVGRSCPLGPGELWMETEDHNIAQNVNYTVFHAMTKNKEDLGPKSRIRSSSATESSKPNPKKQYSKTHIFSHGMTSQAPRERCDSMPSRARTTSEGANAITMLFTRLRPSSQHQGMQQYGHSPVGSPASPPSVGAASSTDSAAGSSYSLADDTDDLDGCLPAHATTSARFGHSLTPDEAIAEEDCCESPTPCADQSSYMQMTVGAAVASSDDGYVDMSPRGARHGGGVTPAHSLSSVTSGTPSTDLRFADYQLDKVVSFFPPTTTVTASDDETRPARAYSVGSRPDVYRQKRFPMDHVGEACRNRAASVGSKAKKAFARVLPPHGHAPPAASSAAASGSKSSSAPLLQLFGRAASSRGGSSGSVAGEMEDLMEMDFTRQPPTATSANPPTIDGYVDMKPGSKSRTTSGSSQSAAQSGYVEMRPGNTSNTGPYMDMRPGTSPSTSLGRAAEDYTFVDLNKQYGLQNHQSDYLEMEPRRTAPRMPRTHSNNNYSFSEAEAALTFNPSSDYMDMMPTRVAAANNNNRLTNNINRQRSTSDNNEGYVEMTVPTNNRGHRRQASLDNAISMSNQRAEPQPQASKSTSDYTIMAVSSALLPKNTKSLPITISGAKTKPQKDTENPYAVMGPWTNDSTSTPLLASLLGRNDSSNESSGSSTVSTTPSSATMFPLSLNSPNSPVRNPPSRINVPASVLNTVYNRSNRTTARQSRDISNDYVNYQPGSSPNQTPEAEGDYACMVPGKSKAAD